MADETGSLPLPSDERRRIDDITRIVVEVLASQKRSAPDNHRGMARLSEVLRANWPVFVGVASIVVAIAAWVTFDVSPLESAREIARQKQQRQYQQELARRHITLGDDFLNVGQVAAARAEFTRAQQLDAYNLDAELGLLKVSVFEPIVADQFDPEIAERRLKAILKENPNDSHAFAFLGDVLRTVDRNLSLQYFRDAVASNPNNAYAHHGEGTLLDLQGKTAEALSKYEKAVSLSEWNQTFLNNLAYQHYLLGNYNKAEELYLRLLGLDSRYFLSYCMLANTQLMLGHPGAAYRNLQIVDAMLKDGTTAKLTRNQGEWFFHAGDGVTLHLYTLQEKAAYARFLMALAAELLRRDGDVAYHLSEAMPSPGELAATSQRVIAVDISRLATRRPDYRYALETFRTRLAKR